MRYFCSSLVAKQRTTYTEPHAAGRIIKYGAVRKFSPSGVFTQDDVTSVAKDHNSLALATAILARVRNPQASAVHYRISTILFHSGVKHDDLNRLFKIQSNLSNKGTGSHE